MALYAVTQSTTTWPLVFFMVQTSDHITGLTGASPTVTLSKNGGAYASPSGSVTEIGNGWYKVAGNATDTNTLGPLLLHATAASGDPTDMVFEIVAYGPQNGATLGLSALTFPTNFTSLAINGSGQVQIDGTSPLTESYVAAGAGFTLSQALYGLTQQIGQMSITGTTMTVMKRNGVTTAKTYTLNSASTPSAITETT